MNEIKISAGGITYRLTDRNNNNKYTRAKTEAGEDASQEQVLAYYDKLGGNIQDKNHQVITNGPFWAEEKARMGNERTTLQNKSDEELETIIRRGENMNVPGSLFQLAKIELELRDRRSRLNNNPHKSGIFFEVGGDMRNDGVIQTDKDAVVGVKVRGNYTSKKGKILQGIEAKSHRPEIVIGVIALLIAFVSIPWWPTWYDYLANNTSAEAQPNSSGITATSTLNISNILAKYNSLDTALDQRAFLKKYENVKIQGLGSYENIDKPSDRFLVTILVGNNIISCFFNENPEIEQRLSLFKKGQSIAFSGIFTTSNVWGGGWTVNNCILLK